MEILGLSILGRNSASCLVRDGRVIAAVEEERFTRRKHEGSFPFRSTGWIRSVCGSGPRHAAICVPGILRGFSALLEGIGTKNLFYSRRDGFLSAAYYPSYFDNSAVLVNDYSGVCLGYAEGVSLKSLEYPGPSRPSVVYAAVTRHLGFSPHGGEFKVMGLAAFGKPRYKEIILKYNEKSPAFLPQIKGSAAKEIAQVNKDIAASLQAAVEEQVLSIVEYLHKSCASENLCMSGNLALNCLINSMIKNQGIYKNIWIQPAATGAGSAIGGALMAWYRLSGAKRQVVPGKDLMQNCYLGPEYGEDSTRSFLDSQGITYKAIADDDLAKFAAGLIAQGKIVGWFQGRAEFGPRALGGRSILADCRKPQMKERLNRDVKIRELFRPFAPVVLYERAGEYFDWDRESHYMLFAVPTRKGQAEKIPSAVNVDGSSRIQTIKKEDNPLYYDMLNEFYKLTGCPAIINTSLNYLGEPIALTPEDAYCCFKNSDMDCLFLGKFLIEKEVRNG